MESHLLLAVLWIIYCILHSVLASPVVKKRVKRGIKNGVDVYRVAYNIFAVISLVPVVWYQFAIETSLVFQPIVVTQLTGIIVGAAGLVLMSVCVSKYFLQLSGLRAAPRQASEELIISGVHQWVRHPLYFGTFLFVWGAWIAWPAWALFICNVVITIYTLIGIRFEEKKLLEQFGAKYSDYQKRVPMIIPFWK